MRRSTPRTAAVALVVALGALLAPIALFGAPAGAQTEEDAPVVSVPGIIPEPNSGRAPEVEGDPGSLTQYLVMTGIIGGLGLIVLMVVRESRSKRAAQDARLSTRSEPVADTSANSPDSSARQ